MVHIRRAAFVAGFGVVAFAASAFATGSARDAARCRRPHQRIERACTGIQAMRAYVDDGKLPPLYFRGLTVGGAVHLPLPGRARRIGVGTLYRRDGMQRRAWISVDHRDVDPVGTHIPALGVELLTAGSHRLFFGETSTREGSDRAGWLARTDHEDFNMGLGLAYSSECQIVRRDGSDHPEDLAHTSISLGLGLMLGIGSFQRSDQVVRPLPGSRWRPGPLLRELEYAERLLEEPPSVSGARRLERAERRMHAAFRRIATDYDVVFLSKLATPIVAASE